MSEGVCDTEPGRLIVISGPSGVGKTTVCGVLLRRLPRAKLSVSATTRQPREGERDGEDYWFLSEAEFERRARQGEFLEHAVYQDHRYGTPAGPVRNHLAAGSHVVLEIDVQGGIQVAGSDAAGTRALTIFVLPPSDETLRERLVGRGTEASAVREKRLAAAQREIEQARTCGAYRYFVVNEQVNETVDTILRHIEQENSVA